MTDVQTDDAPARLLIADGHVRPEPLIETDRDPITGQMFVSREEHYAPRPVHLALDPATGIVHGGYTPHAAMGLPEPDVDQSLVDAQREYDEFRAWRASQGGVTTAEATAQTAVNTGTATGQE